MDRCAEVGMKVHYNLIVPCREAATDPALIDERLKLVVDEVNAMRDHPALLGWAIGNELNLEATNLKVYNAVNDISKMIHEIDPNHPTTTIPPH